MASALRKSFALRRETPVNRLVVLGPLGLADRDVAGVLAAHRANAGVDGDLVAAIALVDEPAAAGQRAREHGRVGERVEDDLALDPLDRVRPFDDQLRLLVGWPGAP